jgi:thiamine phosphate synthase YjbQ (UPF0047 family)
MKSYRQELWFNTSHRREYLNITPQVEECLKASGIQEGLLLCNAMHITAIVL